jgi:hypothetical protein
VVFGSVFLVVLPFVNSTTDLFRSIPNVRFVLPPPLIAVMSAPLTVVNGTRWAHASIGCLYAFALLVVVYSLVVVHREEARGKLYLGASLLVLVIALLVDGGAWWGGAASLKVFLLALCLVLYSMNLLERAGRVANDSSV